MADGKVDSPAEEREGEPRESIDSVKKKFLKERRCLDIRSPLHDLPEKSCNRFWAPVEELGGRFLRVVTLEDKLTIHNAFPDRCYKP
jgi:hypothetical protein